MHNQLKNMEGGADIDDDDDEDDGDEVESDQ